MATATKHPIPTPAYALTLELTQEEAEHLRALVGDSFCTGVNDKIFQALKGAGVERTDKKYS
jgi:hypothetical protein